MVAKEDVALVRRSTDIVDLISEVVTLKREGEGWKGVCPFHEEKTPSFHVDPQKQRFLCFGCGAKGDAIAFLRSHRGLPFADAVRHLAQRCGIPVGEVPQQQPRRRKAQSASNGGGNPPAADGDRPEKAAAPSEEFDWQQCVDALTPEARDRLGSIRGYSRAGIDRFHAEGLLGLFRGCFAVPLTDAEGIVVGCQYATGKPAPAPNYRFFPKGLKKTDLIIGDPGSATYVLVTEGHGDAFALLDAMRHHEEPGRYAAIVTRGVSAELSGYPLPTLLAVPQNDPEDKRSKTSGMTPSEEWLGKVRSSKGKGTKLLVSRVPSGFKDANDWIRETRPSASEVKRMILDGARSPLPAGFRCAGEFRGQVTSEDPNALIGYEGRFLCKGGSLLLVGPSGIGKSNLMFSFCVCLAAGMPWFGIAPRRPLRTVVIQAENDDGDVREMLDAAFESVGREWPDEVIATAESNLIIRQETGKVGKMFCAWLEEVVEECGADIVFVDPLLAYIGDDISQQRVCSEFLRSCLQPVMDRTGVIVALLHHTGKPPVDPGSRAHLSRSDRAYLGLGSSELTNWARAVAILLPCDKESTVFRFSIPKRGNRAGMRSKFADGPVSSLCLAHAEQGLGWVEVEQPAPEPKVSASKGPPGRRNKIRESDVLAEFFDPRTSLSKDDLIARLTTQYGLQDPKTARSLVNGMVRKRSLEISGTRPRPGGGAPIQYLRRPQ